MAAAGSFPSRSHSAGTSVSAASGRYSATCTPHFWPPILIQQNLSPRVRSHVVPWEGAEARLLAAHERVQERAKEGQVMPRSMGIPRAGARLPQSPGEATQERLFLSRRGKVETWKHRSEPPGLEPGESPETVVRVKVELPNLP